MKSKSSQAEVEKLSEIVQKWAVIGMIEDHPEYEENLEIMLLGHLAEINSWLSHFTKAQLRYRKGKGKKYKRVSIGIISTVTDL